MTVATALSVVESVVNSEAQGDAQGNRKKTGLLQKIEVVESQHRDRLFSQ